jgi:hypothetical protein
MRYIEGLITESEEQRLVAFIEGLPLGLDFARSGPDRIGKSKPFAQTQKSNMSGISANSCTIRSPRLL